MSVVLLTFHPTGVMERTRVLETLGKNLDVDLNFPLIAARLFSFSLFFKPGRGEYCFRCLGKKKIESSAGGAKGKGENPGVCV
jgi:hypothetical protein